MLCCWQWRYMYDAANLRACDLLLVVIPVYSYQLRCLGVHERYSTGAKNSSVNVHSYNGWLRLRVFSQEPGHLQIHSLECHFCNVSCHIKLCVPNARPSMVLRNKLAISTLTTMSCQSRNSYLVLEHHWRPRVWLPFNIFRSGWIKGFLTIPLNVKLYRTFCGLVKNLQHYAYLILTSRH